MRAIRWGIAILCLSLAVAGCGGGSDDETVGNTASEPPTDRPYEHYALLDSDDWPLKEAVDPPADDPFASRDRPPLDWYAEYEQFLPADSTGVTEGRMVSVNGHATTFDDTRAALEQVGGSFTDRDVEGWRAVGGLLPDGPAVVILDSGESSIVLLSYELTVEELSTIADAVRPADEAAWRAAGGVVSDS